MAIEYEELYIPEKYEGYLLKYSDFKAPIMLNLHNHRELELNLVTQGSAYYLVNGKRYDIIPGTLLWLFQNQNHGLIPNTDDFKMWIAYFTPALVNRTCVYNAKILSNPDPGRVLTANLPSTDSHGLGLLLGELFGETENPDALSTR